MTTRDELRRGRLDARADVREGFADAGPSLPERLLRVAPARDRRFPLPTIFLEVFGLVAPDAF